MSAHFIVAKFGGTSMGSAEAMRRAASIVLANPATKLVVVSATSGTTDQLLRAYRFLVSSDRMAFLEEKQKICERHFSMAQSLELENKIIDELQTIFDELIFAPQIVHESADELLDAILSLGERVSSILFAAVLRQQSVSKVSVIDARKFLVTDSSFGKAEPQVNLMRQACESMLLPLLENSLLVTQGFIGATSSGATTTLGRGGSDYSAALFAEAIGAKECAIWTDVPGILTMDPNVVATARVIEELGFTEAAEMANFGAKVLHPATLAPAMRAKIPVFVGSTYTPEKGGTRIVAGLPKSAPLVRAIALRKRQVLLTLSSPEMLNAHGFLAKIFSLLARHKLSVDLVTTSEVSVALTVDGLALGSSGKSVLENSDLMTELRSFCDVSVEQDLTLVAIIGNHLTHQYGVAAKAFHSVQDFNIRLICHGASQHNLCFLVNSKEAEEVAKRLHHVLIEWSRT